ncbi:hypothetical protein ACFOHY_14600 [Rhizobium rosettiformans]|uniref:hypothetical protein n=1 Tax=Rhizobium rosettiformans TaxID=1368430 RepID=UPI00161F9313|nr:hypothetical protein [Rhizobium rosettiformans]
MFFALRVDLSRSHTRHQVVLGSSEELLLHDIDRVNGSHDVGDVAMHLQARWLVASGLADDDGMNKVTHDWHQPLFDRFVGVVACEEDQLADPNLDV